MQEPTNEISLREYFAVHSKEFGYKIVESQTGFPDWVLEDISTGKRLRVEAEYESHNFISHGHDINGCDLIVCWRHNANIALPVLEVSTGKMYKPEVAVKKEKEPDNFSEKDRVFIKKVLEKIIKSDARRTPYLIEILKNQQKLYEIQADLADELLVLLEEGVRKHIHSYILQKIFSLLNEQKQGES